MGESQVLLLVICLLTFERSEATFNAYEIKSILYNININSDAPVTLEDLVPKDSEDGSPKTIPSLENLPEDNIVISSQFGQKFICSLPIIPALSEDGFSIIAEDHSNFTLHNVSALLNSSFALFPCLKKTVGWWTYELCFREDIRQYHMEGKEIVGDTLILGRFDSELDWGDRNVSSKKTKYHSQNYTEGTACDLNAQLRKTEVRFYCEEELSAVEAYIYQVDEPVTCQYILDVHVGSLCKLKAFLPMMRSNICALSIIEDWNIPRYPNGSYPVLGFSRVEKVPEAEKVQCRPLLSPEEKAIFMEKKVAEQRKAEEKTAIEKRKQEEAKQRMQEKIKAEQEAKDREKANEEMVKEWLLAGHLADDRFMEFIKLQVQKDQHEAFEAELDEEFGHQGPSEVDHLKKKHEKRTGWPRQQEEMENLKEKGFVEAFTDLLSKETWSVEETMDFIMIKLRIQPYDRWKKFGLLYFDFMAISYWDLTGNDLDDDAINITVIHACKCDWRFTHINPETYSANQYQELAHLIRKAIMKAQNWDEITLRLDPLQDATQKGRARSKYFSHALNLIMETMEALKSTVDEAELITRELLLQNGVAEEVPDRSIIYQNEIQSWIVATNKAVIRTLVDVWQKEKLRQEIAELKMNLPVQGQKAEGLKKQTTDLDFLTALPTAADFEDAELGSLHTAETKWDLARARFDYNRNHRVDQEELEAYVMHLLQEFDKWNELIGPYYLFAFQETTKDVDLLALLKESGYEEESEKLEEMILLESFEAQDRLRIVRSVLVPAIHEIEAMYMEEEFGIGDGTYKSIEGLYLPNGDIAKEAATTILSIGDTMESLLKKNEEGEKEFRPLSSGPGVERNGKGVKKREYNRIFEEIIEEAEEELRSLGVIDLDTEADRGETYKMMSDTLKEIISRLERVEKVVKEGKGIQDLEDANSNLPPGIKIKKAAIKVDSEDSSEVAAIKRKAESLNVKVTEIKVEDLTPELKEKLSRKIGTQAQELEQRIASQLKEAGINAEDGQQFQIKVVTTGFYDEDTDEFKFMNGAASEEFSSLIVNLLGGESEETREQKRYRSMQHGYAFSLDENAYRSSSRKESSDSLTYGSYPEHED